MDHEAYRKALGARIRQAREAREMSQADVAKPFGYHSKAVSKWERGLGEPPPYIMIKLARVLDVPFTWLAGAADQASLDADLFLVPLDERNDAFEHAQRVIRRYTEKEK